MSKGLAVVATICLVWSIICGIILYQRATEAQEVPPPVLGSAENPYHVVVELKEPILHQTVDSFLKEWEENEDFRRKIEDHIRELREGK